MIAALLLAAAPTIIAHMSEPTAIDAENVFARDAQRMGQWAAFRKWSDHDAVMFTPQAVWARDFLKDRKEPPKSVRWWPAHSWISCDGGIAVNFGPFISGDGKSHGYFTTVWQRTGGNWRWVYDGGDGLKGPLPKQTKPQIHRAACRGKAPGAPVIPPPPLTPKQARTTPEDNGRGESADKTLGWDWKVEKNGARRFRVFMWNGQRYAQVLYNDIKP
jgi:hypothetical protein